ncbi:OPT family oligopeptide transporter [Mariniblastus fucicola]|uniref:OPT oligopeptide transporter protein n=1 Tax=Mariniblastus fucicola TaxID=980251 RepID=A0A5B9P6B9_9BACT|nr:oligopeptide transporter, OPT family [Mariniblastus fucicola]QEG20542.1 OPT oligopeptide transporter protein [Mariniblastus fucicola]
MSNDNPFSTPTEPGKSPAIASLVNRPEITVRVIVLGLILSVVMGAANVYVGLKAGMTVSASIPAAVMAMLLFRLLFKNSSILEANQVQTCASAGESLAAGIIFTMPAMILIGYWDSFDFWTITIIAFTGGLLGILFMIPMRKVFVVDNDELKYPEGIACAAVLQAGEDGADDGAAQSLIAGGILGGLFKFVGGFLALLSSSLETATISGSRIFYFGGDLSPMLVAVGLIVRLNVAILIFIGGAIAWLIAIPMIGGGDPTAEASAVDQAYGIWNAKIRYFGVGAMVVGGFASLISVRHGLMAAIKHITSGDGTDNDDASQRDIPTFAILLLGLLCVGLLAMVNYWFTQAPGITVLATIIMLVMGFFFTAVASYIVGLVGNSNSPVSGMTITAVLVAGAMLYLFNYSGTEGMVATLGVAAIVCCIACTSGDVCNDLKTGSIVGASPFRQQIMQILGVFVAAFVMAPILTLLHENTPDGLGIGGRDLPAPQAGLFASLAEGFFGDGELAWDMVGYGAILGVVILGIDEYLKRSGAKFRAYLMPIAVGMYLPFGLATPILIGGLIAWFYTRGKAEEEHESILHRGVLFASGVIAGEALTAVGIAAFAAFGMKALDLGQTPGVTNVLSISAAVLAVVAFFVMSRPKK